MIRKRWLRQAFARRPLRKRGLAGGVLALLSGLILAGGLTAAESPSGPARVSPLRYRKVFLPSEAIRNPASGLLQDDTFVPLRREEFDQLLGAVGVKLSAPQAAIDPQILQATYTARLDGDLLSGAAQLTVAQQAGTTAVLSLEPCNLVISEPRWRPDKKTAAAPAAAVPPPAEGSPAAANSRPAAPGAGGAVDEAERPAELGSDDAGRIVALVDTSGKLQFRWSRRGEKSAAGELRFELRLPNTAVHRVQLTLPADLQPIADPAVVSPLPESPGAGGERSWLIELRGGTNLALRLAASSGAPLVEPLVLLCQDHRYACGLDAVEVAVSLRLDVRQTPLSKLTLALDEPLQLYRAYYRDSPLDWSESMAGAQRQIALALSEPLLGDGHEIRLKAVAPAVGDAAWQLPRVAVPGVFWLEGVSRLDVPEPLWVSHLETVGCRQLQAAPLPAPLRGQSLEIRDLQPRPQIVAMLQRRDGETVARTLTRIKLGTAVTNLECDAELTGTGTPRYDVAWEVLPGWTVDLVETQPSDALEDWQLAFRSPQHRSLKIRFRQPLPADQPLRLTVHAHRRGLRLGERLRGRELRLGTLREVTVARSVTAVAADAAHRVVLSDDAGLKRLAAGDLSSWEQERLSSAAGAVTFLGGETAEDVSLALLAETPSYSAEVHVDSTYSEKWVEQAFRLCCQPIASAVGRLVVHFSEPLATAPRWTFSGEEGAVLARPLDDNAEAAGAKPAGHHSWEIVLPRPRGDAFELLATRSDAFSGTAAVPLASLPAAASQVGYVTIRSATLPLTMEPRNVRPIPAEQPPPGRYSTTRGAFRYDPSLDCRLSVRVAEGLPGSAWVRTCELITKVLGDGRALHTAVCHVENRGQSQVLIMPPASAEVLDLLVSGRPVFRPRQAVTQAGVTVNLPSGERFPTLVICYTAPCRRNGPWATVAAPWPNLGMPIFERTWVVQLPPGWQVESANAGSPAGWKTRLFGLVLRGPQQTPFDPRSARDWISLATPAKPPGEAVGGWDDPPAAMTSPPAVPDNRNPGWTATRVPVSTRWQLASSAFRETWVRVVHRDFFRAAGWAVFLATAGLMVWGTLRRPVYCLPLTALWGCVALVCPVAWVPLASGCFLGSLLSVFLVWLVPFGSRQRAADVSGSSSSSRVVLASTATAVAALLTVLLLAASAGAQPPSAESGPATAAPPKPPAAEPAPAKSAPTETASVPPASVPTASGGEAERIYRVLLPVDDEQQPAEPYVYVPQDFCNRLRREAAGAGNVSQQWLIADAEYRVVFDRDAADPAPVARELVALYRVRTNRAGVRLVLPIRQDQVYLLPNRARLGSRPTSVAWEAEGTRLVVEISEAGEADLELAFRPQVERADGISRCEVLIPRVPTSRVRLQVPNQVPGVDCPSALGGATTDASGERVFALGPADRMVLQWPSEPAGSGGPAAVESELLLWLRIHPGAVVLQAQARFKSTGGRLSEVVLVASPQLRLLPRQEPNLVPVVSAPAGEDQRIRWLLKPPAKSEVSLDLEFVLTGVSGIGDVRIPRLEALADRTAKRWLAISVDSALSYEVPAEGLGEAIESAAFAAAWQAKDDPPQLAVAVADGTPGKSVTTRPRTVALKAAQQLNVAWGADRADLQFEARLDSGQGSAFEHRVEVPEGLSVGSVSVRQGEQTLAAGWSLRDKKTLVVRLDQPVAGVHQLQLRATLATPRGGELALGKIGVTGAETLSDAVTVYRRPAVRVAILDRAGLNDVPTAVLGEHQAGWGRLVADLRSGPGQSRTQPLRFSVTPNRPRTQGTLVTVLDRIQDAWQVRVQYDLQVAAGVVDAVRWEVPADWSGPVECDCPGVLEFVALPDQKRRQLVFRPPQPIAESRRLRITGKLATPQGGAVQALDIVPLDVDAFDRYLCAPTQINQQGIAWKTSGLREIVALPAGFEPPSGPHKTYFATQPRYQATIEDVQPSSGRPRVVLADLDVLCASDGVLAATATFDLQPSGVADCELELPEGFQLVNVAVADLPAMLESLGPQRWRVTLGARQLAQQIEVVYQGRQPNGTCAAGFWTLRPPQLVGIPVEQTMWTIRTTECGRIEILPAQHRTDLLALEFVRFSTRAALIENASEALAASDPGLAARWYSAWRRRLKAARQAIDTLTAADPEARRRHAQQLEEVKVHQAALDEKLQSLQRLPPTAAQPSASESPSWQRSAVGRQAIGTQAALVPGAGAIQVGFGRVPAAGRQPTGAAAAVLLALAVMAWLLLPNPVLQRWGHLAGPLLGIALGGAWWFWCSPSVLGLAVGVTSLLAGLRRWLPRQYSVTAESV